MSSFLSPEAAIIMAIAIILDLAGLMALILSFAGIGIPFSFILDIIGFIFIGGWIFTKSGKLPKKTFRRLGLNTIFELIPFVGDAWFGWTYIVYKELKGGDKKEKPKKGLIKRVFKKSND